MVVRNFSKVVTRVRFSSPAPIISTNTQKSMRKVKTIDEYINDYPKDVQKILQQFRN